MVSADREHISFLLAFGLVMLLGPTAEVCMPWGSSPQQLWNQEQHGVGKLTLGRLMNNFKLNGI